MGSTEEKDSPAVMVRQTEEKELSISEMANHTAPLQMYSMLIQETKQLRTLSSMKGKAELKLFILND